MQSAATITSNQYFLLILISCRYFDSFAGNIFMLEYLPLHLKYIPRVQIKGMGKAPANTNIGNIVFDIILAREEYLHTDEHVAKLLHRYV